MGVGDPEHAEAGRQGSHEPLRSVLASLGRHGRSLGLKVELCDEEWGTGVPLEKYADILAKDKAHEIKAVFATHNETATGVTSDIAGVRKALDAAKHPALLFVDSVSGVGSLDMRMGEWGVDCCVSGSQKGFMLPTGLGILP